jgi:hypothetical protein
LPKTFLLHLANLDRAVTRWIDSLWYSWKKDQTGWVAKNDEIELADLKVAPQGKTIS